MPDPLTPLSVPAGTGLVNATALDGVIASIVAKVNELIAALGTARGPDDLLADNSLHPRMMSQDMIGSINEIIDIISAIRRQYHPRDGMTEFGDTHGFFVTNPYIAYTEPFAARIRNFILPRLAPVVAGPEPLTPFTLSYRVRARVRFSAQKSMYVKMWTSLRGTVTLNGTTTVVGVGSFFVPTPGDNGDITQYTPPELPTNPRIRINGEVRNLVAVLNQTHLVVDHPFSFTGSGFVAECDYVDARPNNPEHPLRAIFRGVLRANPPYAEMHSPSLFAVPTDDNGNKDVIFTEGREGMEIVTSDPPRRFALQWIPEDDPTKAVEPNKMVVKHDDVLLDMRLTAGGEVTLKIIDATNTSVFSVDNTNWPRDDDPRFPLFMRFPCPPSLQFDVLSVERWADDDTVLLTEAGFPITCEAPTEALYTDA